MGRSGHLRDKGIFTKGMTFRIVYQGIMIGLITLIAFILGLATKDVSVPEKIEIGETMAFTVLALSELVHVFNIRNNKESVFKTNPFNNGKLLLAILVSAVLMISVLVVPALRNVFSIAILPKSKLIETIILVFSPLVIVEIFKLLKINTTKDE